MKYKHFVKFGDFLLFTGTIKKTAESAEARREK